VAFRLSYCLGMSRIALLRQLDRVAQAMVQGGLSSTSRTCGKLACPCHINPSRRHGPNLYFTWREEGKSQSLYVPPEHAEEARTAQAAWARFWDIGCQIAALNREQLKKRWARDRRKAAARSMS
jgi:hypothetical protein